MNVVLTLVHLALNWIYSIITIMFIGLCFAELVQCLQQQRMLNSYFAKLIKVSHTDHKNNSLPIFSHCKKNSRSQSNNKSLMTTNNTHNVTLSLYSVKSKKSRQKFKNSQGNQGKKKKIDLDKNRKSKRRTKSAEKSKISTKYGESYKYIKNKKRQVDKQTKTNGKTKLQVQNQQRLQTNKQFYKSIRSSVDGQSTSAFLSKISDIFDLVTLGIALPDQVQQFLPRPLYELKNKLKQRGKSQICKTLTEFKTSCLQVYNNAPSSQISLFLRTLLPSSNRWSLTHTFTSRYQKQQEMQQRQRYYQSLKKKSSSSELADNAAINRIENRLDEFLQKSVKFRKVYI